MAYNDFVTNITNADTDAQALSKFMQGANSEVVKRRIANDIKTLQYYLDYLHGLELVYSQQSGEVDVNGVKVKTVTQAIKDAINTAGVQNGVNTNLVVDTTFNLTQTQINNRTDFVNVINYLTQAEINDLNTANPVIDHTKSLQKAIDASVAQGKKCFIPRMVGAYNIKIHPDLWDTLPNNTPANGYVMSNYRAGLILNTGCHLVFGANTQLKAIATDCWSGSGIIVVGDNVTIEGNNSMFLGERLSHNYTSVKIPSSKTTAEWVTGLTIVGANVIISGLQLKDWTGDCIGVFSSVKLRTGNPNESSTTPMTHYAKQVTIKNCIVDGARRNNISVTDCDGFLIDNCLVQNAGYTDINGKTGTNPKLGIDLEPYKAGTVNDEIVRNGTVSNCTFIENRLGDCTSYNSYNIKIINNHSSAGFSYGYAQNTVIANNVIDMSVPRVNSAAADGKGTGISSIGTSAFDTYNHANNTVITGNVLYGCTTGVDVRGQSATISNNMFVKCKIAIGSYQASDLSIANNFIYQSTYIGISNAQHGKSGSDNKLNVIGNVILLKDNSQADIPANAYAISVGAAATVKANISNNFIGKSTKGLKVECASGGSYSLNLQNNLFDSVDADTTSYSGAPVMWLRSTTGDVLVQNNTFVNSANFYNPISIDCKSIIKSNNFLNCTANQFLGITAANSKILHNIFDFSGAANGGVGVFTTASATNTVFIGNQFYTSSGFKFVDDIKTSASTNNTLINNYVLSKITPSVSDTVKDNIIFGKAYSVTATYDPPSLATGSQQLTTVTLTGAKLGDNLNVSFDKPMQGTRMWAEVTAADTVTVYHRNDTGATVDLPSGTLTVKIV